MYTNRIPFIVFSGCLALFAVIAWLGESSAPGMARASTLCVQAGNPVCYPTISSALGAAQSGDVIRVAEGTYVEYVALINLTVTLQGGWNATFTAQDPSAYPSIIRPPDSGFSVVDIEGPASPTLEGFTITGGGGGNHGGGIRIRGSDAIVRDNRIIENLGYLLGGGIWVQGGAPLIENNTIQDNHTTPGSSGWGGGVMLENTQATLIGNLIANNTISDAVGFGGGVAVQGSGLVTLTGNTILSNTAATLASAFPQSDIGHGGGIFLENGRLHLAGNLIQGNTANAVGAGGVGGAYGYGGGIAIHNSPAFTLTGNTIISNTAGYKNSVYLSAGGLEIQSSTGLLSDNIIAGNFANRRTTFGNGGGIAAYTSTLTILGGEISHNSVSLNCEGYGGGIYLKNSALTLDATRVEDNCAANTPFYGKGGGLAFINSPYTLTNAILYDNYAFGNDTAVGGIYAGVGSPGLLVNNSLVNNNGQGIRSAASITLTNNIIMGHTTGISLTGAVAVNVTYNDFYANTVNQRGFNLQLSNIVINPQLDASQRLLPLSPAIDAGTRIEGFYHDLDGQPRPVMGASGLYRYDIGADEFSGAAQLTQDLGTQPADLTLIGPGNPQDNPASTGSNDWIGFAVFAGDINGDERADLLTAAPNLSGDFDGGVNDDGRAFAVFNSGARQLGVIDLYTSTAGLEVRSWLHQQHLGRAFAASDINGDGENDLIIGSIGGDNNGQPITGTVYVFSGGAGLEGIRTLSPTLQADYRFISAESTQSFAEANSLAAGQLNAAGPKDLVVGETNASGPGGRLEAGAVRVFFGSASLPAVWDTGVISASLTIYGPANGKQLGKTALADVNGDGLLDLIARSVDTVYVFYAPLSGGVIDLAASQASLTIGGLAGGPLAADDLDGDGLAEIVVGDGNRVRIIAGNTAGFAATLTGVTPSALQTLDWNLDGKAELVIGESSKNRVMVIYGGAPLPDSAQAVERADVIILGEKPSDQFGYSLAGGDLDADGIPDLILGSRSHTLDNRADPDFNDAGAAYVLYGSPGGQGTVKRIYLPVVRKD